MRCFKFAVFFLCLRATAQPIVGGSITQPAGSSNPTIVIANASSTGTTANTLTKLTGAPSTAVISATTDTGGAVGVTISGAGTTGNATIQIAGLVNCVFDGATTAGHYVKISSSTSGDCSDGGATYPTTGQAIGRVLSTNASAGTYQIDLFPAEIQGGSGSGGAAGATLFSTTGSTTTTSTSATTLIGTVTGSTTIPANTFTAGQVLEIAAQGFYSTPATAVSLTIAILVGGTVEVSTGAVVQLASVTTGVWRLRCIITTRTAGSSGTQIANCIFEGTGATITPENVPMQVSTAWTVNTTTTNTIDLQATWSTTTGAPTITSTNVAAWIPGAPVSSVNGATGAVNTATRGTFASRPSCGSTNTGNIYYSTDIPATSECNGTAWADWVRGIPVTMPSATSFTTFTSPTVVTNGLINLIASSTGGASLQGEHVAVPSTPYTVIMTFRFQPVTGNTTDVLQGQFMHCGIEFDDGTKFSEADEIVSQGQVSSAVSLLVELSSSHYNSATSFNGSNAIVSDFVIQSPTEITLAASDDGTNKTFWWVPDWSHSQSATTYVEIFQESHTSFLTPVNVGFFCDSNGSVFPSSMLVEDWTTLASVPH